MESPVTRNVLGEQKQSIEKTEEFTVKTLHGATTTETRRKNFRENSTPSVDENPFFAENKGDNENRKYTDDVYKEIISVNNKDEGFEDRNDMNAPFALRHSASAPAGTHKPLSKGSFDSNQKYQKVPSVVETREKGDNAYDLTGSYQDGNAVKTRRKSYKDSAYGSGESSTETCGTDETNNEERATTKVKPSLRSMVSRDPELDTLLEDHESTETSDETVQNSVYKGSKGSMEASITDDVFDEWPTTMNTKPSLRTMASKDPELNTLHEGHESTGTTDGTKQKKSERRPPHFMPVNDIKSMMVSHERFSQHTTPDFGVLCPRSISGSESSSSSQSEKDPTSATPFGCKNSPSDMKYSYVENRTESSQDKNRTENETRHQFTEEMDDVVFVNDRSYTNINPEDVLSMSSCESSLGCMAGVSSPRTENEVFSLPIHPTELNSLSSLNIDCSQKSETELTNLEKILRQKFLYLQIKRKLKKGEPPERLLSLISRYSESDHSSISYFSSIGSGQELQHPSSGQPLPTANPQQPTQAPYRILSDSSSFSLELEKQAGHGALERSPETLSSMLTYDTEGMLVRAAGCRRRSCSDGLCQEGQRLMMYIESFLEQSRPDTSYHDNLVLRTIAEHATLCDELKCPIPWCTFFHEHDMEFEDQMASLHAAYFSGRICLTSEDSDMNEVELLGSSSDTGCKEHVDWCGIARLGGFGNAVLAATSSLENPAFWVVKRENKDVLLHAEVLRRLKKHPRIVQHLWILEQDDYVFFAAKFEGASLADRMNETGQPGLENHRVVKYMEQLASATRFLQRRDINVAYLNWTVENVLLSTDLKFVKVCNFSCAVLIDEICDDEEKLEDLKLMLPPRIVPPEVYRGENVVLASDVWGLGCIWYQMTTGDMVYGEFCHFHPAFVRDTLEASPEPNLTSVVDAALGATLCQCLNMDPALRISIEDLHTCLAKAKSEVS